MTKNHVIAILVIALLLSNLLWVYSAADNGIAATHREQVLLEHGQAVQDLTVLLQSVAKGARRDQVIPILEASAGTQAFEKDGAVIAGSLRLTFDSAQALVDVRPSWFEEPIY